MPPGSYYDFGFVGGSTKHPLKFNDSTDFSHVAVLVQHHAVDLPLYSDLSAIERQQLTSSLQEETFAIRKEFDQLVAAVMEELRKTNHSPSFPMQFLGIRNSKDYFDRTVSIDDVLSMATAKDLWSFYSYAKLKGLRVMTGQKLRDKEQEYDTHFVEYCKRRLRKFPSDRAAVEEKVVFLMDNKMGLQRSAELKLRQLQSQVSEVTGFRVSKLVWIEDDLQEPTLGAELIVTRGKV